MNDTEKAAERALRVRTTRGPCKALGVKKRMKAAGYNASGLTVRVNAMDRQVLVPVALKEKKEMVIGRSSKADRKALEKKLCKRKG